MRKLENKGYSRRRRSSEILAENASPKRRKSSESGNITLQLDRPFSPATLARKLDELREDILSEAVDQLSAVELRGFDREMETEEEYTRRREEIRRQLSNPEAFDANGRTELNYDAAAVAGAKLLIDETRATRSMCKKLLEDCGIDEDDILYKPLSYDEGNEYQSAKHLADSRQASVVESMVDFQKQIKLKSTVLNCVALRNNNEISKSDGRLTRRAREEEERERQKANAKAAKNKMKVMRTPSKNPQFNPLDEKKIIEKYALEVASEVRDNRKRRRIAPVPFDITLLDDIDYNFSGTA
ncbi:unnamed protein product [Heligmosomoides polygyrus]|uniref:Hepatocellular carcinoma-associated antigen 59-domain-containing protein n=1 Tax=Heligmosomoides polygyrus TaxID=6339 RepID=A0A183FZ03_HELPZ|nr:unnamed protein product [Heligmosomoides polygyrus]